MTFVLDSSVTLSWYFEDQSTAPTLALLDAVVENGAVVPPLWRLEVVTASNLLCAARKSIVRIAMRR